MKGSSFYPVVNIMLPFGFWSPSLIKVARPSATCIFSTTDPNLYIKVADLDRKAENELFARLKVVPVPERMAADMAASVKKIF